MGIGYWVARAELSVKAPFRGNNNKTEASTKQALNSPSLFSSLSLSLSLSLCYLIGTRSRSESDAGDEAERKLKVISKYYKGEGCSKLETLAS